MSYLYPRLCLVHQLQGMYLKDTFILVCYVFLSIIYGCCLLHRRLSFKTYLSYILLINVLSSLNIVVRSTAPRSHMRDTFVIQHVTRWCELFLFVIYLQFINNYSWSAWNNLRKRVNREHLPVVLSLHEESSFITKNNKKNIMYVKTA
jgi:hypothetical protein